MQNTNGNADDDVSAGTSALQSQSASREPVVDLPTIAAIALTNSPPWAGDIVASIPEEAGPESAAADTAATGASSEAGPVPRQSITLRECPLHTAMRHLAEAAVAQHVLYLEGEVRARTGLVNTVSRWDRMHTLIRECVCPATREITIGAPALTEIVDQTLEGTFTPDQEPLRTPLLQALETCAACTSAAECPLGAASDDGEAQP